MREKPLKSCLTRDYDCVILSGMTEVALMTTTEVAERFRVDVSAVRRWVASGKLKPTIKTPGGHYRFDEAALAEFSA